MTEYYLYLYERKRPEENCWRDECAIMRDCGPGCGYYIFDEGCVIEANCIPCPYEKDCQNPNCPNSIVESLCAVSLGNMESDEFEDLLSLEPHVLREEQTQSATKIGLEYVVKSVNANNRREAIAIKRAETFFETIKEFVENEGGEYHSLGGRTWDEWQRIINPMLSCIQSAEDILEYRNRNMPVIRTASGQCLMNFRDDKETLWLQSAATGKVNRPTSLAEIEGMEAKIYPTEPDPVVEVKDLKGIIVEAMSVFHDPKNETEAERWDRLSQANFGGVGWVKLADLYFTEKGISPTKQERRDKAEEIRKTVERLRVNK